jgi:hypothetical protein
MESAAWMPYISGEIEVHQIQCRHLDLLIHRESTTKIGHILATKLEKLNSAASMKPSSDLHICKGNAKWWE